MITANLNIERELWAKGYTAVCGLDEVGRGSFAGPVCVGAVIFPKNCKFISGIADSKLISPKRRDILAIQIKENALDFSIGEAGVEAINKVGIGKATQIAFFNAVKGLRQNPDYLLIDAFYLENIDRKKQRPIAGGDVICASIAAASIIAKVYRDKLMEELSEEYPEYNFAQHKGYGTKQHQEAIRRYGLSKIHRRSFNLAKFLV
jgi:ribonuclease HII